MVPNQTTTMVCRSMVKARGKRRSIKWCVVVESGIKWKRLSKRASLEDKEIKGKGIGVCDEG